MAKVTYIEPEELAKLLIESPDDVAVIDVREADYTFGKIRKSLHFPFYLLENTKSQLCDAVKDKHHVVFHCHYSQTRGPAAARIYAQKVEGTSHPTIYVLCGGFKAFRTLYQDSAALYEPL